MCDTVSNADVKPTGHSQHCHVPFPQGHSQHIGIVSTVHLNPTYRYVRHLPSTGRSYNTSAQSKQVLELLRSATSSPYPPGSKRSLEFDISAVESPPTGDQIRTILTYLRSPLSSLISAHPSTTDSATKIDSPEALHEAATRNPKVFRYPVVCDWEQGETATDLSGVRRMLDRMAKARDEGGDGDTQKPKGWFT